MPMVSRVRNKVEMDRGRLPLVPIQSEGNPRYLVNLVDLPEESEELRDTVFYAVFGKSLVSGVPVSPSSMAQGGLP